MKKVIYSKFSNERNRRFSIRTDILELEDKTKRVVKSACYPEGIPHVAAIGGWYRRLQELFDGTCICVNRVLSETDGVELEFLEGCQTLEEKLYQYWQQGKKQEALQWMERYLSILKQKAVCPFTVTEEFRRLFGEEELPAGLMSLPVTDLDLVTENILLSEQERDWYLIDYEWTFDFPIPVHFLIYRIWRYFLGRKAPGEEPEEYLLQEGLTKQELESYDRMETAFQNYVTGGHVPIRELYAQITPGAVDLRDGGIGAGGQLSGSWRSTLYYGENAASFCEEKTIYRSLKLDAEGNFVIEFPTEGLGRIGAMRWDPLERQMCRVLVEEISSDSFLNITPINGFEKDGWDQFWSLDPSYRLEGDFSRVKKITIRGRLQILHLSETWPDMELARVQRDVYYNEMERLRGDIAAIHATKAYRLLEKARRVRNFVLARLDGIGPFHFKVKPETAYNQWFLNHRVTEGALRRQRSCRQKENPKISILVPVYHTPLNYLRDMIESVRNQSYENWELCIADGSVSPDGSRNEALLAVLKEYADADSRIKYVLLEKNLGISENTNGAAAIATGDYIGLLDHDDVLEPDALFEVVQAVSLFQAQVVYTDEDKVSMDLAEYFDPNLKPDFSPDLLCSHNYITHFFVVEKRIFDAAGGFHKECDGAQDYDLIFRCTEAAERIHHITKVLYHWRMHQNSTAENPKSKLYAYEAGKRAIEGHLERTGTGGKVEMMKLWGMNHVIYDTPGEPLVSVIIPNMDHIRDLDCCIRSILKRSSYRNLEILVVENNSKQQETFAYYDQIQKEFPQVRVIRWEREFNYSAINNFGAQQAKGDYLLLLNNDTELMEKDSIREMLGHCMRKSVGCVGAKLFFQDNTVQHAGIVLGFGGFAGHVFSGLKKNDLGFMMRAQITGNYSAVTAACLMVRREVFEEVGGLTEEFAVALNDVDFCLKVREKGYVNVFTPFAQWHHYESKSRGYEDTPEKKERFQGEIARFRERWGELVDSGDPYYNANFSVEQAPFTLKE
ncbi:MAG: glycosyltransferase family 2 protein [Lachnospiraceae bacterium]|nr:glycosyltransferase family 2 protein [Lachnospiraceae bacterium]